MPVGAIIGGVASLGGALLSSSSQKKAANQAAQAQQNSDAATIGLARELYGRNSQNMQPFMRSGQRANRLLDSFLYGGPYTESVSDAPQGGNAMIAPGSYGGGGGGGMFAGPGGNEPRSTNNLVMDVDRMNPLYGLDGATESPMWGGGAAYGMSPVESPMSGNGPAMTVGPASSQPQGQNPWDIFRNSTNYQFRLGQGLDAVQQGYAGAGALQSGAAMRGINDYAQNFASNEFNNYLGLLQGQQALGAGSASALAGVGNDYLGSVTAANRNSADALSNAALLRGQANNNLYGGIAQGLGSLASSFKW